MSVSVDIYLINLDRRPDRLSQVEAQLRSLNLSFIRFSAIDGADGAAAVAKVRWLRFFANHKRFCTRAEQACAASHIAVWKEFLKSHADYALILEDDVEIDAILKDFVSNLEKFEKYDFLNISSNEPYRIDEDRLRSLIGEGQEAERPSRLEFRKRKRWRKLEWGRRSRIFALSLVPKIGVVCECDPAPALGSGYMVSRKAAQNFITTSGSLSYPIDLLWRYSSGMLRQAFMARPIVRQVNIDTDIFGRFDQVRAPFWFYFLRPFLKSRRWKRRWDVVKLYGLLKH